MERSRDVSVEQTEEVDNSDYIRRQNPEMVSRKK